MLIIPKIKKFLVKFSLFNYSATTNSNCNNINTFISNHVATSDEPYRCNTTSHLDKLISEKKLPANKNYRWANIIRPSVTELTHDYVLYEGKKRIVCNNDMILMVKKT